MSGGDVARAVVPCRDLDEAIACFCDRLGFRLDALWPADDPRHAVVCRDALTLELRRSPETGDTLVVLPGAAPDGLIPPPGVRLEFGSLADVEYEPFEERIVVSHLDAAPWVVGRAGMRYRELLPGRLGGRVIASHIQVAEGGPVPDYVHFHEVRFQVIVCVAGWARVVYEDQGEPFVLHAGECVLQPPGIRHRVLEASPGLEVVEVSSPAEHVTLREHHIELPTADVRPDRAFGGQHFVRHRRSSAAVRPWRGGPLMCQETDIAAGSAGAGSVRFVAAADDGGRGGNDGESTGWTNDAGLLLLYCAGGEATVEFGGVDAADVRLRGGSSVAVPPDTAFRLSAWTSDVALVEITVATI